MKTLFIHATSSPDAMRADTGDRRFAIFTNGIDATEVQERLDWKALRDMITIDTSILEFMPTGQHQVAALANLGAELVQEVKAYRPGFLWKSSPAEIVGALIEEMATPIGIAASQVVADEQDMQTIRERDYNAEMADKLADGIAEHFGADIGEHSSANCPWGKALDWLNTRPEFIACAGSTRAALAADLMQPVATPDGWCQFIDGVKTQNVARNEKELADLKEMMKVLGRPGVVEYRPFYFDAPAVQNAAAAFARQLIDSGADNYIGQAFDTECGDIEVTARYTFGKTPAEKLAELEASITAAQADTKDAERYRWLTEAQGLRYSPSGGKAIVNIAEMNAAIDAAISSQNAAKS